jgi:hypothetical protein
MCRQRLDAYYRHSVINQNLTQEQKEEKTFNLECSKEASVDIYINNRQRNNSTRHNTYPLKLSEALEASLHVYLDR